MMYKVIPKEIRIKSLHKNDRNYLSNFLNNLIQTNKSKNTIKSYENDLLQFMEWLKFNISTDINSVTSEIISLYLQFLSEGGIVEKKPKVKTILLTAIKVLTFGLIKKEARPKVINRIRSLGISSRKRHLSCIKNFFEYLKQVNEGKNKKFQFNPVKEKIHGIKLKEIDINHTVPLLPQHWRKISDTLYRVEEKLLANLLYHGGLRLNEVRELDIDNFNTSNKTVTLKRKGGYLHTLKMNNYRKVEELLDLYIAKKRRSFEGPLFLGRDNKRVSEKTMYNRIMNILKKSGLPGDLTPHSFRRACATNLYIETRDLLLVRDYLNHHDAKVTQTYIDSTQLEKNQEEVHPDLIFPKVSELEAKISH